MPALRRHTLRPSLFAGDRQGVADEGEIDVGRVEPGRERFNGEGVAVVIHIHQGVLACRTPRQKRDALAASQWRETCLFEGAVDLAPETLDVL